MTSYLDRTQWAQLIAPINKNRVSKKDNQSHLEAYDVRAHLNRVFGFARWSEDTIDLTMLYEQSKGDGDNTKWRAGYRATVRLTVNAPDGAFLATYTAAAVGQNWGWNNDSKRDEAHDFAIKMAASQALKRCAINLGDQFGLSLYRKGSLDALVGGTIVAPPGPDGEQQGSGHEDVTQHITDPLPPETDPDERGETPPKPRPVAELDAEYAEQHNVTVEEARRLRLEEQKTTRDALGVKSDGTYKRDEKQPERVTGRPPEPDPWAGRANPEQGVIDV